MHIAILGGAFNPVTKGHIQTAEFVLANTDVDAVWFTPCYQHMYNKDLADAQYRLNMLRIAVLGNPKLSVFNYEIRYQLPGDAYGFITKLLADDIYNHHTFSLIIGLDNANTISNWLRYKDLLRLTSFIVVPRKGYVANPQMKWYSDAPHIDLSDVDNNIMDISSTQVREAYRSRNYELLRLAMHPDALDYMFAHMLYEGTKTMREDTEDIFVKCACSSTEHLIELSYDEDCNYIYLAIHLRKHRLLRRIWTALRHIFGYQCRYGTFEEFIIDSKNVRNFQNMLNRITENSSTSPLQ